MNLNRLAPTRRRPARLQIVVLTLLLGVGFGRIAAADETVPLASLDLATVEQGFGKAHADRTVDGNPLRMGGRDFAHGLGTHSPGVFLISLDGGSRRFTSWVRIDDETNHRGSVKFEIVGDGKLLWSSNLLRGGQPPERADVDLTGVNVLALLVDDGGDGYEYDHADWAEAEFTVTGAAPHPTPHTPGRQPDIAAPVTIGKPEFTSPETFGVRPGTPVLYDIDAAGALPITYAVRGLPPGLKYQSACARIEGTLEKPGTYSISITARNSAGQSHRDLKLTVGDIIARTPPIGWNSYDSFGDDVSEAEILTNASAMKTVLKSHGWDYVVVDYRWYDPGASSAPNRTDVRAGAALAADRFGRLQPAPNRFPSAVDGAGFKNLAAVIHDMGLRFGIHVMRGIPRQAVKANSPIEGSTFTAVDAANTASICPWCPDMYGVDASKPAGQAWYDSIVRQYAGWGVDYIKVDDLSSPYSQQEIEAIHKAIEKCGRSIVLSLSPGETPIEDADNVTKQANLWRISGDFWDSWGAVSHQFDLIARWKGRGGPGFWPDADMIPLGHLSVHNRSVGEDRQTNLSKNEQVTLMTLWSMAPSPLMLGMNMPENDAWTTALLSDDEVIAVNQDPLGAQATRLRTTSAPSGAEVWTKSMADGSTVIGLFNRISIDMPIKFRWADLNMAAPHIVRDLWRRTDLAVDPVGFETVIGPHGAAMIRVR